MKRETELWIYSADGSPVKNISCHIVRTYNPSGKITSFQAYDSEEKPFFEPEAGAFKLIFAYDVYGNMSDVWCFDADNAPCQAVHDGQVIGIHHVRNTFDSVGKRLSVEGFDTEEKPGSDSVTGTHKILIIYDSYGMRSEIVRYDKEGRLLNRKLIKYDSDGNEIEEEKAD